MRTYLASLEMVGHISPKHTNMEENMIFGPKYNFPSGAVMITEIEDLKTVGWKKHHFSLTIIQHKFVQGL